MLREAQEAYNRQVRAAESRRRHRRGLADEGDGSLGRWHFNWHRFDPTRNRQFRHFLRDVRHGRYQKQIWGGVGAIGAVVGAIVFGPKILQSAKGLLSGAGGKLSSLFSGGMSELGKVGGFLGKIMGGSREQGGGDVTPETAAQVTAEAQQQLGPGAPLEQVQALASQTLAQRYPAGSPQQQAEFAQIPSQLMPASQAFAEQVDQGVPPAEAAAVVANTAAATKDVEKHTSEAGFTALVPWAIVGVAGLTLYSVLTGRRHAR